MPAALLAASVVAVPSTEPEAFGRVAVEAQAVGTPVVATDLGAVAETLALSLDPFPRAPDADAVLRAAGVLSEDEAVTGPFAALKGLKDKLSK